VAAKPVPFVFKLQAAAAAGIIGTSAVFPIDLVKTRLQAAAKAATSAADVALVRPGPVQIFRGIVAHEGARGLYRGLIPNLIGVTPEKAIKLAANDAFREAFLERNRGTPLSLGQEVAAGFGAGFLQVIATNPMEIVKIRLQMQTRGGAEQKTAGQIVRHLGIRGLYRGVGATLMRDAPYGAIFFPLYARFSKFLGGENPQAHHTVAAGLVAGGGAAGLMTPADVVKTRLQVSGAGQQYTGVMDCAKQVYAEGGMRAMFKGAGPRMAVQAPLFGIALLVFEVQKKLLGDALR
jgi:solute carrier family 25 aspartate/glutamate transporter 12/13